MSNLLRLQAIKAERQDGMSEHHDDNSDDVPPIPWGCFA